MIEVETNKCTYPITIPFGLSWSKNNLIAVPTERVVIVYGGGQRWRGWQCTFLVLLLAVCCQATDITDSVFGTNTSILPAAFGDFNLDEYTDLFVLEKDRKTVAILLGGSEPPLLKYDKDLRCTMDSEITGVVPGDFDGDGLMDVLLMLDTGKSVQGQQLNLARVLWGNLTSLDCSGVRAVDLHIVGQPLLIDYNGDMVMDLFGVNESFKVSFWVFNDHRDPPKLQPLNTESNRDLPDIRPVHSNAFVDLNSDSYPDLYVTTDHGFEVWLNNHFRGFQYNDLIPLPDPKGLAKGVVGQTLFVDVDVDGTIDHLLPVCFESDCANSRLYVYTKGNWYNLSVNFHDGNNIWGFADPRRASDLYTKAITLRAGDYNMDGYPDLLVTLQLNQKIKSVLLENVACEKKCGNFYRTFAPKWDYLPQESENTALGVFYDFANDGVLDVMLFNPTKNKISAHKNNLDYDANFLKVMVLSGITNKEFPQVPTPLGKMRKTYGISFPGPMISYQTTTQEGDVQKATAPQLAQSAYFPLLLPYSLFGLGRTPNFIDSVDVMSVLGQNKSWAMIVPNSQVVIVPQPHDDTSRWFIQLFVTPSKIILQSFIALLGSCAVISVIILILWWKERRQDNRERRQGRHRFPFDAM